LTRPPLAELAQLDDAGFRRLFAKTAIKRTGRDRFVRNVLIAIGNSGDPSLAACVERLIDDPAGVVRGAACGRRRGWSPNKRLPPWRPDTGRPNPTRRCGTNGPSRSRMLPRDHPGLPGLRLLGASITFALYGTRFDRIVGTTRSEDRRGGRWPQGFTAAARSR